MSENILENLYQTIVERSKASPDESYVARTLSLGQDEVLKKIAEESAEVMLAVKNGERSEVVHEMADLWFHCLLALAQQGISLQDIYAELDRRRGVSGLTEKASRQRAVN